MEEERNRNNKKTNDELEDLISKAQKGDNEALEMLLKYFNEEIQELSKYIRLPKEETIEELKVILIEIIKDLK